MPNVALVPYPPNLCSCGHDYQLHNQTALTVGGTTGAGPVLSGTVNGVAFSYTQVAGDTTNAIAAGHLAGVMATQLANLGPTIKVSGAVVTVLIDGAIASVTSTATGGATLTNTGALQCSQCPGADTFTADNKGPGGQYALAGQLQRGG